MSKFLSGIDALGFLRLNGNDVASQIYVDAAVASAGGSNFTASTETSLGDHLTAIGYDGSQYTESDIVYLPNAPKGLRKYWHSGTSNNDATDFVNIDEVLTNDEVRTALAAGQGITYSAGEFSIANESITPQMLDAQILAVMSDAVGFSADIVGDGTTLSFPITHNAGTKQLAGISLRDVDTDEFVQAQYFATDDNTITVVFAVAPVVSKTYRLSLKRVS
ncbi:hypothetical protein [Pseudoalteromonas phage vB_PtuP_Slicky01]|nr:hypothetical protein [Pseudoalteromonas phage vB_PtuP_Slicky01]